MGTVWVDRIAGETGVHRLSDMSGWLGALGDVEGEHLCSLVLQLVLLLDDF
jgi:hypothetical protein